MLNAHIHVFHSSLDCDDCGLNMSDIITLSGDLGDYTEGDEAACFGTRSGYLTNVLHLAYQRLREISPQLTNYDQEHFYEMNNAQVIKFFKDTGVNLVIEHEHDEDDDFEDEWDE